MLVFSVISTEPVAACTRALYVAENGRGIARDGAAGENTPRWTSKYGSVIAAGYDIGSADGMNEAGLVANLLYLAESDYGEPGGKPVLSISLWAQ